MSIWRTLVCLRRRNVLLRLHMSMLDVIPLKSSRELTFVDATFPVFEATNEIRVVTIEFAELPENLSRRKSHLSDNGLFPFSYPCIFVILIIDAFLLSIMTSFPNSPNYTLIYTSSPSSHVKSHKRTAVILTQDDVVNSTKTDKGGLFQHYQFFTPAIYMGYIV